MFEARITTSSEESKPTSQVVAACLARTGEIVALSISPSIDVQNPRAVVIDLEVYLI